MVNANLTNMTEDEVCGELQHDLNKNICSFHSNQVRGHFYNVRKILGGHS